MRIVAYAHLLRRRLPAGRLARRAGPRRGGPAAGRAARFHATRLARCARRPGLAAVGPPALGAAQHPLLAVLRRRLRRGPLPGRRRPARRAPPPGLRGRRADGPAAGPVRWAAIPERSPLPAARAAADAADCRGARSVAPDPGRWALFRLRRGDCRDAGGDDLDRPVRRLRRRAGGRGHGRSDPGRLRPGAAGRLRDELRKPWRPARRRRPRRGHAHRRPARRLGARAGGRLGAGASGREPGPEPRRRRRSGRSDHGRDGRPGGRAAGLRDGRGGRRLGLAGDAGRAHRRPVPGPAAVRRRGRLPRAPALRTPLPGSAALALQMAQDWYAWQQAPADVAYSGICAGRRRDWRRRSSGRTGAARS